VESPFTFALPYEASPTIVLCCVGAAVLYWRGRHHVTAGRATAFWIGLTLIYLALQTRFDYYAQHMFFIHRLQHLLLHHVGPFLIAWAAPAGALAAGVPKKFRRGFLLQPLVRWVAPIYRVLQQPMFAALLFVGLIYLWLIPEIHFTAMLNVPLYNAMNWGMAIDGLLFWWMVFNRRAADSSDARHYGGRILLLFLIMFPQIIIGAYIALSRHELYQSYAVCGRAWPLSPITDQQLGGLITWIPPAMMSIAGALILLRRWMDEQRNAIGKEKWPNVVR